MAKSTLRYYKILEPFNELGDLLGDALFNGTFAPTTKRSVTLEGSDGGRIVFKGDFNVDNGIVTGGKVTGYTAYLNGRKVMKATNLDVTFADLQSAIEEARNGGNEEPLFIVMLTTDRTFGSNSDDLMFGIAPLIRGRGGDDTIFSGFGDKTVKGESGDDTIMAGIGDDDLFGGKGWDIFAFTSLDDGVDHIHDFKVGKDRIGLYDGNSFNVLGETVDPTEFVVGEEALTADHHLIYDAKPGRLYWDEDGVGGAGKVLLARLPDGLKFTAANFLIDDFT